MFVGVAWRPVEQVVDTVAAVVQCSPYPWPGPVLNWGDPWDDLLVFALFSYAGLSFAWSELQFWTVSWKTMSASAVKVLGELLHREQMQEAD